MLWTLKTTSRSQATEELNPHLLCLVIAVTDGDSLKARCGEPGEYEQVTIRLAEVDAPESGQAYGQRSKQSLAGLCYQQQAAIKPVTKDRYGRTVARVQCQGQDASAYQVGAGMAWVFVKYSTDPSLTPIEAAAMAAGVGLWADPQPVAPWAWRQAKR